MVARSHAQDSGVHAVADPYQLVFDNACAGFGREQIERRASSQCVRWPAKPAVRKSRTTERPERERCAAREPEGPVRVNRGYPRATSLAVQNEYGPRVHVPKRDAITRGASPKLLSGRVGLAGGIHCADGRCVESARMHHAHVGRTLEIAIARRGNPECVTSERCADHVQMLGIQVYRPARGHGASSTAPLRRS